MEFESINQNYFKSLLIEKINFLFNNSWMSDITFVCADKEIKAHKLVLGMGSEVFHRMFYGHWKLLTEDVIYISDTSHEYFLEFLQFVYTDKINLNSTNSCDLLYLARKYMVKSLEQKCYKFFYQNLNLENVVAILQNSEVFGNDKLKVYCLNFIHKNISILKNSKSFMETGPKLLKHILKEKSEKKYLKFNEENKNYGELSFKSVYCYGPPRENQCQFSVKKIIKFNGFELNTIRPDYDKKYAVTAFLKNEAYKTLTCDVYEESMEPPFDRILFKKPINLIPGFKYWAGVIGFHPDYVENQSRNITIHTENSNFNFFSVPCDFINKFLFSDCEIFD